MATLGSWKMIQTMVLRLRLRVRLHLGGYADTVSIAAAGTAGLITREAH